MFACNETAIFYARIGQQGGKPAYAQTGVEIRCRSEPVRMHRFSGNAAECAADTRLFMDAAAFSARHPRPGDRIALNGRNYRIAEVQILRGWRGIHHLEMLVKGEGGEES